MEISRKSERNTNSINQSGGCFLSLPVTTSHHLSRAGNLILYPYSRIRGLTNPQVNLNSVICPGDCQGF